MFENELIENLRLDESNPNVMTDKQIKSVANSIKKYGFIVPLIINKDNIVIDGHQRLKAAELIGIKEVPVIKLNVTKVDAKLLKQILNKLKGTHDISLDLEEYKVIFEEQGDLDLLKEYVAMDNEYINNIIREIENPLNDKTDEELDDVPEVEEIQTDIKYGDIIQLGNHRIMCGDSTKKEDVDKLMNGQKVDMVFTDPPYGIDLNVERWNTPGMKGNWKSNKKEYIKVIGDEKPYEPQHLFDFFGYCKEIFIWGGDYFCKKLPLGTMIVWDKRSGGLEDVQWSTSEFEICWSKAKHHKQIIRWRWLGVHGMEKEDTAKRIHPTQKPAGMCQLFLDKFSKPNNLIVDLFLGSGSTLIACEKTDRVCYGMELSEKYCEVICQRYEKLTGKQRLCL